MKIVKRLLSVVLFLVMTVSLLSARTQQPSSAPGKSPGPKTSVLKPTQTPATSATRRKEAAPAESQQSKPAPSPAELIDQGKSYYRSIRFKQALAKFEDALKIDPDNDEALGLAAVTAFRLDNQPLSREYFLKRVDLPEQKESVKAYCYYRVALTYWREAHDMVGKNMRIVEGRIVYQATDQFASDAIYKITNGLDFVQRALAINDNFSEAFNIRNLLYAEAALAETDEAKAKEQRELSIEALRKALDLSELSVGIKRSEAADFSQPTIRIAEFPATKEAEDKLDDPIMKMIEGGRPIKRVQPVFPSVRPPRNIVDPNDPSAKGVTQDGGATSIGAGRGALTAAYLAGAVKVEILISTTGDVVFAHIVDGRSDLNGAALVAARSWKFEPARFEGRPVQLSGVITFELKPRR